jgi:cytoskeletal protein CcmA (bactofilin family)
MSNLWDSFQGLEGQHWISGKFEGRGDLKFSGHFRFAGRWVGTLISEDPQARLFILDSAIVSGRIRVDQLFVAGVLQDIDVKTRIFRVLKGSKIFGRVVAEKIIVEEGALVQGDLICSHRETVSQL